MTQSRRVVYQKKRSVVGAVDGELHPHAEYGIFSITLSALFTDRRASQTFLMFFCYQILMS